MVIRPMYDYDRVSNLKYESVCIGSKTVVFIRANPDKKETTDGLGSHVISFGIGALFRKWYIPKNGT